MSPQAYNARVGLALFCPVVTEIKGYPFEVLLPADLPLRGAILADQAESFDWRALRAERVCSLPRRPSQKSWGSSGPFWDKRAVSTPPEHPEDPD